MDLILDSKFDAPFKLVLIKAFNSAMKEVLSDVSSGDGLRSLELRVAEAILGLASQGQISPGQLQRHAVSQVKAYLLTENADHLYIHRSRRPRT